MKLFYVRIQHIATGIVYSVTVLSDSLENAQRKAADYPYANDAYIVLKGESK